MYELQLQILWKDFRLLMFCPHKEASEILKIRDLIYLKLVGIEFIMKTNCAGTDENSIDSV